MTSREALRIINLKNRFDIEIVIQANEVLYDLVERDIPKKPFVNIDNGIREYNCGVCVCMLDIPQLKELNFCPKCGNRIDWGGKKND